MALKRLNLVNTRGIPALENIRVTLNTSGEYYVFNNHPYSMDYFQGFFVVKITGTPTAPTQSVPIYFDTDGLQNAAVPLTNATGAGLVTGELTDGVYLCFYDRTTNVLRLMTTI